MTKEEALELLDDKKLDIEIVNSIYNDFLEDEEVVALVAMNISRKVSVDNPQATASDTMTDLLTKLSSHEDMSVRWAVAKSPHTKPEVLQILAADSVNLVRALVATNANTPIACLDAFMEDEKIVRDGLTGNPNCPQEFLIRLSQDSDKMVKMRVASNPATPKEVLQNLAKAEDKDLCIIAQKALEGTLEGVGK
ncbi:MAG: hypothetical protein ACQESH_07100 [Campylobacterota bacterium]